MSISVALRGAEPEAPIAPIVDTEPVKKNEIGAQEDVEGLEPVSLENRGEILLDSLGVKDEGNSLSSEDQANLDEVGRYIEEIISRKGLNPTRSVYQRVFGEVMEEMEIDKDMESSRVLDKISGVIKSWRDLAFIKDAGERRKIFMRLSRMQSSQEMNKLVMAEMEAREIWQ